MSKQLRELAIGIVCVCSLWVALTIIQYYLNLKNDARGGVPDWILASVLLLPFICAYLGIKFVLASKRERYAGRLKSLVVGFACLPPIGMFAVPAIAYYILGL